MAKKSAKSKGFRKQNVKKPYLSKRDILVLCVVVALLAVGAFFLFRYDDGALKVKDGAVVTEGDNWLIVDGSNVRGRSRYFKLGEMGEIDGYSRETRPTGSDANVPSYVFTPTPEDGNLTLTVTTSHNAADALADNAWNAFQQLENNDMGELQTAEVAGRTMHYFIFSASPEEAEEAAGAEETAEAPAEDADAEEAADADAEAEGAADAPAEDAEAEGAADAPAEDADAEDAADAPAEDAEAEEAGQEAGQEAQFTKAAAGYVDATHDSCLVIHVESSAESIDACPSDEALTALLEQAVSAVTLEEAK